ncbi:hypothetical protein LTR27_011998 [Elasticomyces elasticus]|nr:hypothetical protein LTR27_011998 [Elasticomyces elasticus]
MAGKHKRSDGNLQARQLRAATVQSMSDSDSSQTAAWSEQQPPPQEPTISNIRILMNNQANEVPYHVRLRQHSFPDDEYKIEILRMAPIIIAQMPHESASTPERRAVRDKIAKWTDVRDHPQWLDDLNKNILSIMVGDAYWDLDWMRER